MDHRGKTPKKLGTDFVDHGIPVASAILVKHGVLDLAEARYVSEETYNEWMKVPVKKGDVLLTSEAPLGRVALVQSDEPLVLGQRLYGLRGRSGVLDSRYLYYALQTDVVQSDLVGRSTGSTVFGIRQSALRKVLIPAPSFDEQRAIAEVLGALDDKIAANTHLVSTSLQLANAQFVDAAAHSMLSDLTFADVADVGGGGTPKTKVEEYWGDEVTWATPTDVTALHGPYLRSTSRRITQAGLDNCSSALYPPGSILMTSRATVGAFAVLQTPMAVNQGFIVVNSKGDVPQWWLFHEMQRRVPEFVSHANGATFLELSRGKFKKFRVHLAANDIMQGFADIADALHKRAAAAERESASLASTRDALLPLLMSGKVTVRDAESVVEGVM